MKKFFVLILVAVLAISMVACNDTQKPTEAPTKAPTEAPTEAPTQAPTEAPTQAPTEAPTEATIENETKSEGVMEHSEYVSAEMDAEVVIEAYIQGIQVYSEQYGNTSIYLQDKDGAYFVYRYACTAEEYAALEVGQKVKVTGYKAEWSGELEIADAEIEIIEGATYLANAKDVTANFANPEALIADQNVLVVFKGLTVAASKDADGNDVAFLYKYNGSGTDGDDLYFNVTDGTKTYSFCVETDLCGADSDVYAAVKALEVGDKIDIEGFLYWYNNPQLHTTSVTVVTE